MSSRQSVDLRAWSNGSDRGMLLLGGRGLTNNKRAVKGAAEKQTPLSDWEDCNSLIGTGRWLTWAFVRSRSCDAACATQRGP